MENQESITLQLHYFFNDKDSHSMNARIHNDCDKQFIQAVQILNKYLDIPFDVIVFAKNEGGIKDLYKIVIKDPLLLIILTTLIANTTQQFFTSNFTPSINITEETKTKLDNVEKIKNLIKSGSLTDEEFEYITSNDKDLRKLKSSFYKSAKKEQAMTHIEFEAIKQDATPIFEKKSITYTEFDNCILTEEQEKLDEEIDAKIYIVSPVLTRGRKDLWKGIYKDDPIEFKLSDKVFLENVYQHIIKFSNGTYINCKMIITTTRYSIEEKEKISRNVLNVNSWGDDDNIRTVIKRKRRSIPDANNTNMSLNLFSDIEENDLQND